MIKEVIVVEGRDDENAINRSVEARTIATHGFGIRKATWDLIQKAYDEVGIIIFTDPDFAGEQIRKRLSEKFPKAKHAHLSKAEAEKAGDIGIENARPEDIREALEKTRCTSCEERREFSQEDLMCAGLTGGENSSQLRDRLGQALGIGYGNNKVFLHRLNHYGVTREEFEKAWTSCMHQAQSIE